MQDEKSRLLDDVPVFDIPCKNRAKHYEFRALILLEFNSLTGLKYIYNSHTILSTVLTQKTIL